MIKGKPIKARTREGYRGVFDQLISPTFGTTPLALITPTAVRDWYAMLVKVNPKTGKRYTGKTRRAHAYGLLRTVMHTAVDDDLAAKNPCRIKGGGEVERESETRIASKAELDVIVAAVPERYRLMILLAAWCALRFGELTELRRCDIDIKGRKVKITRGVSLARGEHIIGTPKTRAGVREISIPEAVMPTLTMHLLAHTDHDFDALLFPPAGLGSGTHMRPSTRYKVFYPAREKAGRPDLRLHDLRHTGATVAGQLGATDAELQHRLGHSSAAAMRRYQHATPERDELLALRISKFIDGKAS